MRFTRPNLAQRIEALSKHVVCTNQNCWFKRFYCCVHVTYRIEFRSTLYNGHLSATLFQLIPCSPLLNQTHIIISCFSLFIYQCCIFLIIFLTWVGRYTSLNQVETSKRRVQGIVINTLTHEGRQSNGQTKKKTFKIN